jgi:hypothetical protein
VLNEVEMLGPPLVVRLHDAVRLPAPVVLPERALHRGVAAHKLTHLVEAHVETRISYFSVQGLGQRTKGWRAFKLIPVKLNPTAVKPSPTMMKIQ